MQAVEVDVQPYPILSPEETVLRIQRGAEELRNAFIAQYQPFIAATTSRLTRQSAQGSDEYSVALDAFNEAIDRYDPDRNRGFLSWSDLIINHRVIDYMRRSRRQSAFPFSLRDAHSDSSVIDRAISHNPTMLQDHVEIKEEIEEFRRRLSRFGIELSDLVQCAPKHLDTRTTCVRLARRIADTPEIAAKLEHTRQLPVAALLDCMGIGKKAVQNNRKYIIAIYIALTSGMEIIKSYIKFTEEGVLNK